MQTINLVDKDFTTIPYTKHKYTDGHVGITLDDKVIRMDEREPVIIVARFNTYEDLFYVLAATDVLQNSNRRNIYLAFTYFMGQDNDKREDRMQSFDLKIITDIINSKNYSCVLVNGPSSSVLPALLNNCREMPESVFLQFIYTSLEIKPEQSYIIKDHQYTSEYAYGKVVILLRNKCEDCAQIVAMAKDLKHFGAKSVVLASVHGVYPDPTVCMKELDMIISTNSIYDTNFPSFEKQLNLFKKE